MATSAPDALPRLLAVAGVDASYVIEPARFELGLTRVQMVDRYLAMLLRVGMRSHPDVDTLLGARCAFAFVEDPIAS